ncbi:hypothetical protein KA344_08935 [bacterium]|jgi:hypothetical protein|nr:hypothetical protein [bacterium]
MSELNPQLEAKAETQIEVAAQAKLMPVPLVALARGTGSAIDLFSMAFLALIPLIYDITANNFFSNDFFSIVAPNFESLKFMAKYYGASIIGLVLICTPLPIIYLRLFFKRIMKTPTLGETIAGITSYSIAPGFRGIVQESQYGLSQWLVSSSASIFAGMATYTLWNVARVIIEIIAPGTKSEALFGSFHPVVSAVYILVCFALSFIAAISFSIRPRSRTDLASYLDDCCQLEVKRLR